MRTAEEIKSKKIEWLEGALRRPRMYGGNDSGVEMVLRDLLGDLCFIDEREAELDAVFQEWHERELQRACRPNHVFRERLAVDDVSNEVASVYAHAAARLGYYEPARRLTPAEWKALRHGLRQAVKERDWTEQEVRDRFGPPSYTNYYVLAYAPEDDRLGWVFFDFEWAGGDRLPRNNRLRNVRIPARQFAREFVFTPFGEPFRKPR
jgi:hypothetical protein